MEVDWSHIELLLGNMSSSFVIITLAGGYIAAGILLILNLYRTGFLKGNVLGITASAMFVITAITYFAQAYLTDQQGWQVWARFIVHLVAFLSILAFIVVSLRSRFIMGGYKALTDTRRELEQQERWMKLMQEYMTDGLAVFSPQGNLLYVNPAATKFLKIGEGDVGDRGKDKMFGQGASVEDVEYYKDKILNKERVSTKITFQKGQEGERIVEVNLSPVMGKWGQVIAIAASYHDITELHKLERAKEEFIQIASHELRTPLTAVRGFLSLLKMDRYGKTTTKQRELIEKGLLASNRLSKLVDNLLLVARIEESRVTLNPEVVDVEDLITSVAQELAGEASRCSISLRTLLPTRKLPEIIADREKLQHVLSNLISNAIKYTSDGGHVFIEPRLTGNHVEIAVTDTGVGIAQEDVDRLFHKFERIKNNRSIRVGGSGLGLVIVKSFVELHGGKVLVTSRSGHGSTFTVVLPIKANAYA